MNKVTKTKVLYYSTLLVNIVVVLLLAISIQSSQWKSLTIKIQDFGNLTTSRNSAPAGIGISAHSGLCKVDLTVFGFSRTSYYVTLEGWFVLVGGGMFVFGALLLLLSCFGVDFKRMNLSKPISKLLVKSGMFLTSAGGGILLAGLLAFTFNLNKSIDWATSKGLMKHVVEALSLEDLEENIPVSVPEDENLTHEVYSAFDAKEVENGWAFVACWVASAVSMISGIASYFISDMMGNLSIYEFQYSHPAQHEAKKHGSSQIKNEAV